MNKEEIIKYIEKLECLAEQSDRFFRERNDLYAKNKELEQRIDKAIEYINKHSYDIHKVELLRFEIDELLEILKGEE